MIEIADPADGGAALRRGRRPRSATTTGSCSPRPTAPSGCSPPSRDARAFGGARGRGHRSRHGRRAAPRAASVADLVPERFVAEALLEAFAGRRRRRPGAAGPGRGGPRRAARRAARRGLGGRRRRRLPHRARRRRPTSSARAVAGGRRRSPSRRRPRSSTSSTPFGADAVPPVVACIGPVTAATARDARARRRRRGRRSTPIDGLVDALVELGAPRVTPRGGRLRLRRPDHRQRVGDLRDGARPRSPCTATTSRVEAWATIVGLGDDDDELAWATLVAGDGHRGLRRRRPSRPPTRAQDRSEPRLAPAAARASRCSSTASPRPASRSAWRRRSSPAWLERHLDRLGLLRPVRRGASAPTSSAASASRRPTSTSRACADLGADPAARGRARGLRPRRRRGQGGRHGRGRRAEPHHRASTTSPTPTSWSTRSPTSTVDRLAGARRPGSVDRGPPVA